MPDGEGNSMIQATAPARAEFIHVLRSVASGAGAMADLSIDAIEDLRLAVDEACAHLLRLDPDASTLSLAIETTPTELAVTVAIASERSIADDRGPEAFLAWHILGALTDGADAVAGIEGPAIRFTKRRASIDA